MSDEFINAVGRTVDERLGEINTIMPGVIVSYDPGTNRAVVRPSVAKRLADGSDLAAPQIVSVPVKWPGGGGGSMTFPIKPGDPCELRFSQRSLDNWLGGSGAAADDPRAFDLTDCICDPGLAPVGITGDAADVVLAFGPCSVRFTAAGSIVFKTAGGTLTLGADGKLSNSQDIVAGTISLQTHKHIGVQSGASNTGVPTP